MDVRSFIELHIDDEVKTDFLPQDVRSNAHGRMQLDAKRSPAARVYDDVSFLEYTDFADLSKILASRSTSFPAFTSALVIGVAEKLKNMAVARNRVCHSRPLDDDDLTNFVDLAEVLIQTFPTFDWEYLRDVQTKRKSDPSFIFRLEIPSFWQLGSDETSHNLPMPDFDETGFLGRANDRKKVLGHLRGPHPVVTIVGEGGVGKTALALSCAYSVIELPKEEQFDCIVWVSLKAKVLTASGIRDVRDCISSTLGLLQNAASRVGSSIPSQSDVDSLIAELHQYMSTFKILLIIDNLEALPHEQLRSLLSAVPGRSKVFITSRIGLGELEVRYKLDSLDAASSIVLLRRAAASQNLGIFTKAKNETLELYVRRLFHNPLLIKWFVSSVSNGADPNRLLIAKNEQFSDAIRFCFENLFDRLSETEKLILYRISGARRPLSQAELLFLMQESSSGEMGQALVEEALATLHNSSMVRRSLGQSNAGEVQISLTEIASEFLSKVRPPSREIVITTGLRLRELQEISERSIIKRAQYKYDIFAVRADGKEQRIAGAYLQFALQALKSRDFEEARKRVEQARTILPSWSETYRIWSIVEDRAGNVASALEYAETAVECDPQSTTALYQLALYLFQTIEDAEAAEHIIELALALDSEDETLITMKALLLTRLGHYPEAAGLYERVIHGIEDRPRKWRIATRDQAAGCYRRWAQQDRINRDEDAAQTHSGRAIEILEQGASNKDIDSKSIALYAHTIEDELEWALVTGSSDKLLACLEHLANPMFPGAIKDLKRVSRQQLRNTVSGNIALEQLLAKLEELNPEIAILYGDAALEPVALSGVIKRPPPGKKFAFIRDSQGKEWFFHEHDLIGSDWSGVIQGRRVTFSPGFADGKERAVNVELH